MAAGKKRSGPEKPLQEDRILARLVDDSTQITSGLASYTGLLGRSPKEGHWLLYLTLDMTLSVEIREEDIVHSEQLPPDKSPFGTLGGTQVFVKKNAMVTTTRTASLTHEAGATGDEFDLDIRLGGGAGPRVWCHATATTCIVCPGDGGGPGGIGGGEGERPGTESCFKTCHKCVTEATCKTDCNQATCRTCQTQCGTCQTCQTCQTCNTCNTKCGQATCHTCKTECGQATCHTCGQETCATCVGCFTKVATCANTCDFC